ncbi:MAG: DPP IV N-terminal domain-containing protein [Crocinitomicaceae bacterium]|nr:DPP IV N-terminal domain-containing protein [Crocinitomicaceae bacterium]
MRILLFLYLSIQAISSITIYAQKEPLTLDDAVFGQWRKFRINNHFQFQWIPSSNQYSYLKDFGEIIVGNLQSGEERAICNIIEINNITGSRFNFVLQLEWIDANSFIVSDGITVAFFDHTKRKGNVFSLPEKSDNFSINKSHKALAYTFENNLFIAPLEGKSKAITRHKLKEIVAGQSISRSEFGIKKGVFWSPTGSAMAFYEKDESKVDDYPIIDISSRPATIKEIKYPMAGKDSEQVKVGVRNIKKKKINYIEPRTAKDAYLTNLSWSQDDQFLLIAEVARSQKEMWLQLYNAKNGKFVSTLLKEERNTWVEPEHPALFLNDNTFLWLSDRDGYRNIYLYNLSGKLLQQITAHQFPVLEIIGITEDNKIVYRATGENPMNQHLFQASLDGEIKQLTTEDGINKGFLNTQNNQLFITATNPRTPHQAWILDLISFKEKQITNAENTYADIQLSSTEIFSLKAADEKTDLYGRIIYPSDFDSTQTYPLFLYVYGGPHAQLVDNSWLHGADLWMHYLAEKGVIVLSLDNRGSANRGVHFEHVIHRNLGDNEVLDQLRGVNHLLDRAFIDVNKVGVHGWSYGGFMTIKLLYAAPELFKVGIAGGPVTDWKFYEVMYGERYMDTPQENPDGYKKASLINNAKQLESNLRLIHGTSDDVVVMQNVYALLEAFVKNKKQVDFFAYPMHEHNISGLDRLHLMNQIFDYFFLHIH